jgi:hypothetical protein
MKVLEKEKALEKFQKQIDLIPDLKNKPRFSPDFNKWYRDTEILIERVFGKETRNIKDFSDISYAITVGSINIPDHEIETRFHKGLDNASAILQSFIDEIIEYWDEKPHTTDRDSINIIENICNRFHLVDKQLRSRRENRNTLEIEDEYDVQDLLHALLHLEFDDIRPEEYIPSYAGSSSRMDFLLKQEQVIIEVKKTRQGLRAKEIGEELMIDIQRYQSHPDCQTLICFVYDPERSLSNPRGIENDLNRTEEDLTIKVIIAPM